MRRTSATILLTVLILALVLISSSVDLPTSLKSSSALSGYSSGRLEGPLAIPSDFSGDWYWVTGDPYLQITLERSSLYRGEDSSIFLTVTNIGRVESFRVNQQPEPTRRDEILAAQKELQLEAQRTTAQDVSVSLVASNQSAIKIKREVSYAGSLRDGQVSSRLEFPLEVYENTNPGDYDLNAVVNYTFQRDVAVKPHTDSPENPDIFYLYDSASQTIPLILHVEKKSLVDLKALEASPASLMVGSKNNLIKVLIENQGSDTAKDVVARLRPENGIYVDMDESPIPRLGPGEEADLVYKVDVSKDALGGKPYRFTILFDFSDSYRKNLQDSDHVYIDMEPNLVSRYWWLALIAVAIAVLAIGVIIRQRRRAVAK